MWGDGRKTRRLLGRLARAGAAREEEGLATQRRLEHGLLLLHDDGTPTSGRGYGVVQRMEHRVSTRATSTAGTANGQPSLSRVPVGIQGIRIRRLGSGAFWNPLFGGGGGGSGACVGGAQGLAVQGVGRK